MADIAPITAALDALKLKYAHEKVEDGFDNFTITLDDAEGIEVTGLLYDGEDGSAFRLLGYVDELSQEQEAVQLKTLLALNGDLPTGAFCLDPEEGVVYVTVNLPVEAVEPKMLEWALEFTLVAQELYFQEFYGDVPEGEDLAQG
jgi:hypothetical protein